MSENNQSESEARDNSVDQDERLVPPGTIDMLLPGSLRKISNRLFVGPLTDNFLDENQEIYVAFRFESRNSDFIENLPNLVKISSAKPLKPWSSMRIRA